MAFGQFAHFEAIDGLIELRVEIVNPEFVKIAKYDVGRAVRDEVDPVIEGLLVVLGEFRTARLHFDQGAARQDEIGEFGALAGEADAVFEGGAFGERIRVVAERFEEMKKEGLGFAFFVALETGDKLGELYEASFERCHLSSGP